MDKNLFGARPRRAAIVVALLGCMLTGKLHAQGFSEVVGWGSMGPAFEDRVDNGAVWAGTPGPIDLGSWHAGQLNFAAASGAQQTLRAVAAGSGGHDDGNQVDTRSRFEWTVPVGPGSSNLALGAPVTVHLDLRIDGRLAAGWAPAFGPLFGATLPAVYNLSTDAAAWFRYDVYDLDAPGYENGAPDLRFDFRANVVLQAAAGPEFIDYVLWGHGQNASASLQHGGSWVGPDNGFEQRVVQGAIPGAQTLAIDTGLLRFSIDTFVGNTLRLEGELGTVANGILPGLSWKALADFGSTFHAALSADVPGVAFGNLGAGLYNPAPVPEPASAALLLAGLAGIAARVRRRARGAAG